MVDEDGVDDKNYYEDCGDHDDIRMTKNDCFDNDDEDKDCVQYDTAGDPLTISFIIFLSGFGRPLFLNGTTSASSDGTWIIKRNIILN